MAIPYHQLIMLIFAAILIAACAPALTATPLSPTVGSSAVVSGTPTSLPTASPSPHPTYVVTAMSTSQPVTSETRIRVIIGDTVLTGRLWDNAAARDLIDQLPLTLTFSDFNRLEKIATLPRQLSTAGVPAGADPSPRDIGYYSPWGNLVFYYGDVGYFNGIVRIGQFDGNMNAITSQKGSFTARVELAK